MTIKHLLYLVVPKPFRKSLKRFYYNKIAYRGYEIINLFKYSQRDFFNILSIETTTYCNLRCKFCPNSKYERSLLKNKKLMTMALFKKIIDELALLGYNGLIMPCFYGEPLSDERFLELVAYMRMKLPKTKILVNTNGFLFTVELYKKLVKAGVNSFTVSQYDSSMAPAMVKLFDYLKTRPKKENKINYRFLNEDCKSCEIYNRGGEVKIARLPDQPPCLYGSGGVTVDYAGNVILCCNDYHCSITFGNLKKEKLLDIWNKSNYKKLRWELKHYIFKLPICKKCVGLK